MSEFDGKPFDFLMYIGSEQSDLFPRAFYRILEFVNDDSVFNARSVKALHQFKDMETFWSAAGETTSSYKVESMLSEKRLELFGELDAIGAFRTLLPPLDNYSVAEKNTISDVSLLQNDAEWAQRTGSLHVRHFYPSDFPENTLKAVFHKNPNLKTKIETNVRYDISDAPFLMMLSQHLIYRARSFRAPPGQLLRRCYGDTIWVGLYDLFRRNDPTARSDSFYKLVRETALREDVKRREEVLIAKAAAKESQTKTRIPAKVFKESQWFPNISVTRFQSRLTSGVSEHAMPVWSNIEEMDKVYLEAAIKTKQTSCVHHVDHIVPLKGIFVSGLHVPWNLRAIPKEDNLKKGNKFPLGGALESQIYQAE